MWLKIAEEKDVVSFKKMVRDITIVIEARKESSHWHIYKTHQLKGANKVVQEYLANSREDCITLIEELKAEKPLSMREIKEWQQKDKAPIRLHVQRDYKEYDVEKWMFTVNESPRVNVAIIRYGEEIVLDVMIHEQFRSHEKKIIQRLHKTLNVKDMAGMIKENIYYFSDEKHYLTEGKRGMMIGRIQMDFEINNE